MNAGGRSFYNISILTLIEHLLFGIYFPKYYIATMKQSYFMNYYHELLFILILEMTNLKLRKAI